MFPGNDGRRVGAEADERAGRDTLDDLQHGPSQGRTHRQATAPPEGHPSAEQQREDDERLPDPDLNDLAVPLEGWFSDPQQLDERRTGPDDAVREDGGERRRRPSRSKEEPEAECGLDDGEESRKQGFHRLQSRRTRPGRLRQESVPHHAWKQEADLEDRDSDHDPGGEDHSRSGMRIRVRGVRSLLRRPRRRSRRHGVKRKLR